ncbi:hypothetical protein ABZS96_20935 [Streptomyces avermitilis]|uniref:hypothetical protein n=1 Tax=Streptomyces avermitilis TaxID=33903 RepID=UPI0033BB10AC
MDDAEASEGLAVLVDVVRRRHPRHAQKGLTPGQYRCTSGCGTTFDDELAWVDASQDPYSSPIRIRPGHPAAED